MGFGIQPVVDRNAALGSEAVVGVDYRLASTVGEYRVVARDQHAERVAEAALDAVEGGRDVDPKTR